MIIAIVILFGLLLGWLTLKSTKTESGDTLSLEVNRHQKRTKPSRANVISYIEVDGKLVQVPPEVPPGGSWIDSQLGVLYNTNVVAVTDKYNNPIEFKTNENIEKEFVPLDDGNFEESIDYTYKDTNNVITETPVNVPRFVSPTRVAPVKSRDDHVFKRPLGR